MRLFLTIWADTTCLYDSEDVTKNEGLIGDSLRIHTSKGLASELTFSYLPRKSGYFTHGTVVRVFGAFGESTAPSDYNKRLLFFGKIPSDGLSARSGRIDISALGPISFLNDDIMRYDSVSNMKGYLLPQALRTLWMGDTQYAACKWKTYLDTLGIPFDCDFGGMKTVKYLISSKTDESDDVLDYDGYVDRMTVKNDIMPRVFDWNNDLPLYYNIIEDGYTLRLVRDEVPTDSGATLILSESNKNMIGVPSWNSITDGSWNGVNAYSTDANDKPISWSTAKLGNSGPCFKNISDTKIKTTDALKSAADRWLQYYYGREPYSVRVMTPYAIGSKIGDMIRVEDTIHGRKATLQLVEKTITTGEVELVLGERERDLSEFIMAELVNRARV